MKEIYTHIAQPWPWFFAGPLIGIVMFLMIWFGKKLGISSNLETICSVLGAGKTCSYFDFDWKQQLWNLVFAIGLIAGGFIAKEWLTINNSVELSSVTIEELQGYNIQVLGLAPEELFNWKSLLTIRGIILIVIGGFLVGFGTRYAGGCTSGHAISGLSQLQLPSLIAVIGFFIGGLVATYALLPFILTL